MEETRSSRLISLGAFFLAVIMLVSLFGPYSFISSAAAETSGDYEYELINGDTEVKIKKYTGPGGDVIIPAEIDGKPIVQIDYRTFDGIGDLTAVTISAHVYSVNPSAFWDCPNLTALYVNESNNNFESVDGVLFSDNLAMLWAFPLGRGGSYAVPGTTTSIGYEAFAYCAKLASVTVPDSVTTIYQKAFYFCTALTGVTLGNGIISISDGTFSNCRSLGSITIPDSVTSIGSSAFNSCSSLTEIDMGSGVTSIGMMAFDACTSLTSIDIPGNVLTIGLYAFIDCTALSSLTLNDGLTTIGQRAFLKCVSLTVVDIPDSVASIADSAFDACTALEAIEVETGNPVYESAGGVLYNEDLSKLIRYPCGKASSYNVPDSVSSLGESAFTSSPHLTAVRIGENVTDIPMWSLAYCGGLEAIDVDEDNPNYASVSGVLFNKDVTEMLQFPSGKASPYSIPNSVTSLRDWCMAFAQNITSLDIPEGVVYVGEGAITESPSLQTVTVPASAEFVGDWNFADCPAMTAINVHADNPNFSSLDGVLFDKDRTTLILYPEAKPGDYVIPAGVEIISEYAFNSCFGLTSITVPASVTIIESHALIYLTGMKSILFEGDAPVCGEYWYGLMNESLIVYYYKGSANFTSPTWSDLTSMALGTPSAPMLLSVTADGTSMVLVWSAPEDDGNMTVTGYKIFFGNATPDQQFGSILPNETTTFTVTGLEEGTKYFFAVTAVNELGESDMSNIVNATTEGSSDLGGSDQTLIIVLVLVIVAIVAAVAVWWFKFRK